jgi:hypothetical protein
MTQERNGENIAIRFKIIDNFLKGSVSFSPILHNLSTFMTVFLKSETSYLFHFSNGNPRYSRTQENME